MWDWIERRKEAKEDRKNGTCLLISIPGFLELNGCEKILIKGNFHWNRWQVSIVQPKSFVVMMERSSISLPLERGNGLGLPPRNRTYTTGQMVNFVRWAYGLSSEEVTAGQRKREIASFERKARACGWKEKAGDWNGKALGELYTLPSNLPDCRSKPLSPSPF